MKRLQLMLMLLALSFIPKAFAFQTNAERIESYLHILESSDNDEQEQMLSRLQWSGLSDPALYDVIEQRLLQQYQVMGGATSGLMAYHARALGYSGNEKYRQTLQLVSEQAANAKLRSHAARALTDLDKFSGWWSLLPAQPAQAAGQSIEAATYLQMLNTDNVFVQRLAARAIFHEGTDDEELLERAAELIRAGYLESGLDEEAEDTIAWLCKAIGQNAAASYRSLLADVADRSPSGKIAKYAGKYAK